MRLGGRPTTRLATFLAGALLLAGTAASQPEWQKSLDTAKARLSSLEAREDPDTMEMLTALSAVGKLLREEARYEEAREHYERALALAERSFPEDDPQLAIPRLNFASVIRNTTRNAPQALELFERACPVLIDSDEHFAAVACQINWALELQGVSRPDEASERYDVAIEHAKLKLGPEHPLRAQALYNSSGHLTLAGRHDEARARLEEALRIREKSHPDHPLLAGTLTRLAGLESAAHRFERAEELNARAMAIQEKVEPGSPAVARLRTQRAGMLHRSGRLLEARQELERALDTLAQQESDQADLHDYVQSQLALVLAFLGDVEEAERQVHAAIGQAEERFGRDSLNVSELLGIATFLKARQSGAVGAEDVERGRRAVEGYGKSVGPRAPNVGVYLCYLAELLSRAGQQEEAERNLAKALEIALDAWGPDSMGHAVMLGVKGRIADRHGDSSVAVASLSEGVALVTRLMGESYPDAYQQQARLARALARAGRTAEAWAEARDAAAFEAQHVAALARGLSQREALLVAGSPIPALQILCTLADREDAPRGAISQAWQAVARRRALTLNELALQRDRALDSTEARVLELASAHEQASKRLAGLLVRGIQGESVEEAQREVDRLERELATIDSAFARTVDRREFTPTALAPTLPKGSALVAYWQHSGELLEDEGGGAEHLLAFVLRAGSEPRLIGLGLAEELDLLVSAWAGAAGGPPFDGDWAAAENRAREAGRALRERAWDPLADALAGSSRIFVVPAGSLHRVNLAALPDDAGGYLVESFAFHHLAAERELLEPGLGERRGTGLLAVGGVDFDADPNGDPLLGAPPLQLAALTNPTRNGLPDEPFAELPRSRVETREVARTWRRRHGNDEVVLLLGAAATEAALREAAPGRRALHVATHGFFTGDESDCAPGTRGLLLPGETKPAEGAASDGATLSGLALAGANRRALAGPDEDDGVLTAREVATLPLEGVEWCVLTACQAGAGPVHVTEGVLGLPRAFRLAGVRTLIMSLWPVDDRAARDWAAALYEERFVRGAATPEAVARASRRLIEDRRARGASTHPWLWGGFVSSGDWR